MIGFPLFAKGLRFCRLHLWRFEKLNQRADDFFKCRHGSLGYGLSAERLPAPRFRRVLRKGLRQPHRQTNGKRSVATNAAERARVATNIVRIADHILAHDLYLVDVDGKPTLWGRWNPEYVNWFPLTIHDRQLNNA